MRYRLHLLREETARASHHPPAHPPNTYIHSAPSPAPRAPRAHAQMSRRQNRYSAILSPASLPSRPPRDRAPRRYLSIIMAPQLGPAPTPARFSPRLAQPHATALPTTRAWSRARAPPREARLAPDGRQRRAAEAPPPASANYIQHNASGGRQQVPARLQARASRAQGARRGVRGGAT